MSKMTLLEMVANILNAMDSDEVNSIDDTVESAQVAEFVKECFSDLMTQRQWPFLRTFTAFDGLGDTALPTTMQMQEGLNKVLWVKYNKKKVTYLDPEEFQELLDNREELADVVDSNGYVLNRDPIYWTTYDDKYAVFDGYDSAAEATLQTSNSSVYGVKVAEWTHEDNFIPDMPEKFFPTLLAEAKATCFLNMKQQANGREERKAQRGRVMLNNEVWRAADGEAKYNRKVNYGRR
jgi:hypothetical protein